MQGQSSQNVKLNECVTVCLKQMKECNLLFDRKKRRKNRKEGSKGFGKEGKERYKIQEVNVAFVDVRWFWSGVVKD